MDYFGLICVVIKLGLDKETGNLMLGGNPAMDHRLASPPGGSRNIPSHFMLQKLR